MIEYKEYIFTCRYCGMRWSPADGGCYCRPCEECGDIFPPLELDGGICDECSQEYLERNEDDGE